MGYEQIENRECWNTVLKRAAELGRKPALDVGFPIGGVLGRPTRRGSGHKPFKSMAEVAYVMGCHEKGLGHNPKRPFMMPAMVKNKAAIDTLQERTGKAILLGQMSVRDGMNLIGQFMAEKIKQEIREMTSPALKPATIKRKGNSLLLQDTGQAINSVTWVIRWMNENRDVSDTATKLENVARKTTISGPIQQFSSFHAVVPSSNSLHQSHSKRSSSSVYATSNKISSGISVRKVFSKIIHEIKKGMK